MNIQETWVKKNFDLDLLDVQHSHIALARYDSIRMLIPNLSVHAHYPKSSWIHCSSIHAIMQPECVKTKSNHAWPKYHILKTSFPLLLHLRGTKIQSHGVSILKWLSSEELSFSAYTLPMHWKLPIPSWKIYDGPFHAGAAGLVRAYTCKIGNKTAAVAGVIPFLRKFQKGLNYGGCKSCWPRPAKKCSPWAPTSYPLHMPWKLD